MSDLSDEALSALGVNYTWQGDRVMTLADFKPRHVGRILTADHYETLSPDDHDNDPIMGVFEGIDRRSIIVGGEAYPWANVSNVKVWRRGIVK